MRWPCRPETEKKHKMWVKSEKQREHDKMKENCVFASIPIYYDKLEEK